MILGGTTEQLALIELDIDTRILPLWQTAEERLEQPEDDLALVGSLMRAAWGYGYFAGLSDPHGDFLRKHGCLDERYAT